jgi:large subunit ribosomal protein L32
MVIRMRHTRAHTANRRSHHALKAPTLAICGNCEAKQRPHHMCQECGFYKGRLVIDMKAKTDARSARMQAKKDAIKASKTDNSVEEESEAIPGEVADAPLDTAKSKAVEAPEMSQAKTATPRKGQAS